MKYLRVFRLFWYDFLRFAKYSGSLHSKTREQVLGHLIHGYHRIEKGLTMPHFHAGFGQSAVRSLMKWIEVHERLYGKEEPQLIHAVGVLKNYQEIHRRIGATNLPPEFLEQVADFCKARDYASAIEQPLVTRAKFYENRESSFPEFAWSRHSLRHYGKGTVPVEELERAVALAMSAPSACNRQPIRVYCVANRQKIDEMMDLQGGNRGFGKDCDKLLVVTADLSSGNWINERNSLYFDAGLFTLNLCYALHYGEIAHCILNWSTSPDVDRKAHSILDVPDHEEIAILIACGRPVDEFRVPLSPRKDVSAVWRTIA